MNVAQLRRNPVLGAILLEGLLSRLSFGLITFALPLYARHLGWSYAEIGLLISLNTTIALVLKPLAGGLADRVGLKRAFLAALGLRSAVSFLLGFAAAPWELFAIRSAHGLSMSLRSPSAHALIAEHGGKKSIASAFAWYQTAKSVAGSLSKALAGILLTLTAANFSLVFFTAFALSLLPPLAVWLFVKEKRHSPTSAGNNAGGQPEGEARQAQRPSAAALGRRKLLPYVGLGFLITATAEMLGGLFPVLAKDYAGLSEAQIGLIYAGATVVTLIAGPLFGWFSDHISQRLVLMVRSGANTVSAVVYLLAPSLAGVAAGRLLDDIGKAAYRPAWGSLMAEVANADKRTRARTIGWMSLGDDLGRVLAPVLAGLLWSVWGLGAVLGTRIVIAAVTEIFAVRLARGPSRLAAGPGKASAAVEAMQDLSLGHQAAHGPVAMSGSRHARHEAGGSTAGDALP